jgi:thiol-disulfide isomerase/thioredoxin
MSKFEEIFIKEKMRFAIVLFVGLILGFSQCNSSDSTANEKLSLDQFLVEIGKEKLTMVDFYTTWCGPCKQMAPFIEEIKMENKDVVNVLKVDAEDQIDIA